MGDHWLFIYRAESCSLPSQDFSVRRILSNVVLNTLSSQLVNTLSSQLGGLESES